jgi:nicotinamide mononucleotide adenylyltransferase
VTEGSVHGRFQPLHNEHLEYLLAAKQRSDYLWIGITKYDITGFDSNPLGRPRERPENNPLTFFERITIISGALVDAGVDRRTFGFVPFPIETPNRLTSFMPLSIPCLTTVCETWNKEKIEVLKAVGYEVIVLYEKTKGVSGSEIRKDIASGGVAWKESVPKATQEGVERFKLRERLIKLSGSEASS